MPRQSPLTHVTQATTGETLDFLESAARGPAPAVQVVQAPRGWGKSALLRELAGRLERAAVPHAFVELARCASHPDEFACSFVTSILEAGLAGSLPGGAPLRARSAGIPTPQARLRALITESAIQRLRHSWPLLEELASELGRLRGEGAHSVRSALALPPLLEADLGRPVVLLIDSLHELTRLTPFPGLRDITEMVAVHLGARGAPPVVATVAPHGRPRLLLDALRENLGHQFTLHQLPPVELEKIAEMAGAGSGPGWTVESLQRLTAGRLLPLEILGARLRRGESLMAALAAEAGDAGGRLSQELRFDYHIQIERTRGHAACKSILNILAREEGLDLSGIARRLRRSGGSTLDYLKWLSEVGLIERAGRRYSFADPLLRLHILLHEVPERPAGPAEIDSAIGGFIESLEARPLPLRPLGRPRAGETRAAPPAEPALLPEPPPPEPEAPSSDSLMEID